MKVCRCEWVIVTTSCLSTFHDSGFREHEPNTVHLFHIPTASASRFCTNCPCLHSVYLGSCKQGESLCDAFHHRFTSKSVLCLCCIYCNSIDPTYSTVHSGRTIAYQLISLQFGVGMCENTISYLYINIYTCINVECRCDIFLLVTSKSDRVIWNEKMIIQIFREAKTVADMQDKTILM